MSRITSGAPSFREMKNDSISESATNAIYPLSCNREDTLCLLALLNSKVGDYILPLLNPTINVVPEDIRSIPLPTAETSEVFKQADENCTLSEADWNAYETSWDFKRNPLV